MTTVSDPAIVDEPIGADIGHRVTRNYAVSVARLVVAQVVAGVAFVLLSRRLAPPEYALYAGFGVAAPTLYYLLASPLMTVLVRRETPLRRDVVDAAFTFVAVVALVVALVGVAVARVVVGWNVALLAGVVAYLVGLALCFPNYVVLSRNVRTGSVALVDFTDRATFQVVTVVAVVVGVSVQSALALALAATAVAIVVASQVFQPWRLAMRSPRSIRPELREAAWPALTTIGALVGDAMLIPLVGALAGGHEAGLFGWAFAICAVPLGFVAAIIQVLYPALARVAEEQVTHAVELATRAATAIAALLSVLLATALPSLVSPLFSDRWTDAVPVLWLLLAALVVFGSCTVLNVLWSARISLRESAVVQLVALGVSFVAAVPLIHFYGAIGCAIAYLAGRLALAAQLHVRARRRLTARTFLPVAPIVVLSPLAALAGLVVANEVFENVWLIALAATVIAVVVLVVGGAVSLRQTLRSDAVLVRSLLRPPPPPAAEV